MTGVTGNAERHIAGALRDDNDWLTLEEAWDTDA